MDSEKLPMSIPMTPEEFKALKTLEAGFRAKHGDGPWTCILRNCIATIDDNHSKIAQLQRENTRMKNELANRPKKPRKPVFDKETTLAAYWSPQERDLEVWFPTSKSDAGMMFSYFGGHGYSKSSGSFQYIANPQPLLKELEARGYDVTTLRFSVKKKTK